MRVLVTGGAGYIGSHCVRLLQEGGIHTVVFDDLRHGSLNAVQGEFVCGDILNKNHLDSVFRRFRFDAVFHFAALIAVEESVEKPFDYVHNNTSGTLALLEAMRRYEVGYLIFSSTAAVYGNPQTAPITEAHPRQPLNPYGLSKVLAEQAIEYYAAEHGIRAVMLRYFNAAGREFPYPSSEFRLHDTHLITRVLGAAAGDRPAIDVYGTDYATHDGTCVRDYVHVRDICRAHLSALDYLRQGKPSTAFNIGSGTGYSVREVIEVCRQVSGRKIQVRERGRRSGDPAVLVASNERIRAACGWTPEHASLASIIESAWRWHGETSHTVARTTIRERAVTLG